MSTKSLINSENTKKGGSESALVSMLDNANEKAAEIQKKKK